MRVRALKRDDDTRAQHPNRTSQKRTKNNPRNNKSSSARRTDNQVTIPLMIRGMWGACSKDNERDIVDSITS